VQQDSDLNTLGDLWVQDSLAASPEEVKEAAQFIHRVHLPLGGKPIEFMLHIAPFPDFGQPQ
jgi:hypothetical protein